METTSAPRRASVGRGRGLLSIALLGVGLAMLFGWGRRLFFPSQSSVAAYSHADYEKALRDLASAQTPHGRYADLSDAAKAAVHFGTLDEAEGFARELLDKAQRGSWLPTALRPRPASTEARALDWNYGNAVHDGHEVLGLVALRRGHLVAAKKELLLAGETPGSAQLDSFGPNMMLAKELLEHGEVDVVVQYFERCRKFWRMHGGRLNRWTSDAQARRTPDFGANLIM